MHPQVAGIDDFGFNRQAFEIALPIALFDGEADVNFIAGPVNPALRKNECVETFRSDIFRPIDFEPRKIQHPVLACERHERDVVAIMGHKRNPRFLALGFFHGWKSAVTVRGSFRCLNRDAVLAQNFNRGAADRLAGLDRHQENVAAAVCAFLRQNSNVGYEKEPAILD